MYDYIFELDKKTGYTSVRLIQLFIAAMAREYGAQIDLNFHAVHRAVFGPGRDPHIYMKQLAALYDLNKFDPDYLPYINDRERGACAILPTTAFGYHYYFAFTMARDSRQVYIVDSLPVNPDHFHSDFKERCLTHLFCPRSRGGQWQWQLKKVASNTTPYLTLEVIPVVIQDGPACAFRACMALGLWLHAQRRGAQPDFSVLDSVAVKPFQSFLTTNMGRKWKKMSRKANSAVLVMEEIAAYWRAMAEDLCGGRRQPRGLRQARHGQCGDSSAAVVVVDDGAVAGPEQQPLSNYTPRSTIHIFDAERRFHLTIAISGFAAMRHGLQHVTAPVDSFPLFRVLRDIAKTLQVIDEPDAKKVEVVYESEENDGDDDEQD